MCKQLDQTMYVSQHASKPDGTAETAPVVPESVTPPPIANPKLVLQQPLAPPARRATARRRDRRRGQSGLTPAWPGSRCVLASPDAPPAHAARGVRRLTPPRTRTARPKRMHRGPHTRGALGAALALHARRAPVGRWELKAGGRAEGLCTVGQRQCVSSLSTVHVRLGASDASGV